MKRTHDAVYRQVNPHGPDHSVDAAGQHATTGVWPAAGPPHLFVRSPVSSAYDLVTGFRVDGAGPPAEYFFAPLPPARAEHPHLLARTALPSQDPLLIGDRYREDLPQHGDFYPDAALAAQQASGPRRRAIDLGGRRPGHVPAAPQPLLSTLPPKSGAQIAEALLAMKARPVKAWHAPQPLGQSRALARLALLNRDFQQAAVLAARRSGVERFHCEHLFSALALEIDAGRVAVGEIVSRVTEICDGFENLRLGFTDHIRSDATLCIRNVLKQYALEILRGIFNSSRWHSLELIYEGNRPSFYQPGRDPIVSSASKDDGAGTYRRECHDVTFLRTLAECMAARAAPARVSLSVHLHHPMADCDFMPKGMTATRLRSLAITGLLGPLASQGLAASLVNTSAERAGLQELELTGPDIPAIHLAPVLAALGRRHRLRRLTVSRLDDMAADPKAVMDILRSDTLQALELDAFFGATAEMLRALHENRSLREVGLDLNPISADRKLVCRHLTALFACTGLDALKVCLPEIDRELGLRFANWLTKDRPLRLLELELGRDNVGGLYPIFDTLRSNTSLRQLHLPRTGLTVAGISRLVEILATRDSPLHLVIGGVKGNPGNIDMATRIVEDLLAANAGLSFTFTGRS